MAEKKSPGKRAGKREPAKPEPEQARGRSRPAQSQPKTKAKAKAVKSPKASLEMAAPNVKPPRKSPPVPDVSARAAAIPAVARGTKKRGLPKLVAETVSLALSAVTAVSKRVLRRRPAQPRLKPAVVHEASPGNGGAALTEEERIESSKYEVRELPRRVFEEERFLFPETYEADRVRLLVKDPEWLFAHWDVSPGSLQRLRDDLGERALAMSPLTLKLEDPADSALSVVLLPEGARSWYLRTHLAHRAYRAQLGVTMPSGEFRPLATSNVVVAPRGGQSPQKARRRVAFSRAHAAQAVAELVGEDTPASQAEGAETGAAFPARAVRYIDATGEASQADVEPKPRDQGGASDELGPGGASDVFRR